MLSHSRHAYQHEHIIRLTQARVVGLRGINAIHQLRKIIGNLNDKVG